MIVTILSSTAHKAYIEFVGRCFAFAWLAIGQWGYTLGGIAFHGVSYCEEQSEGSMLHDWNRWVVRRVEKQVTTRSTVSLILA